MKIRKVIGVSLFLTVIGCTATASNADIPQTHYAVLSLIGDSISVVMNQDSTGSLIDRKPHQSVDLPPAAIDNAALLAADDALRRGHPERATVLLQTASPELHKLQSQLIEGDHLVPSPDLQSALGKAGADYLLLISKRRDTAALQTDRVALGSGTLYGVGFYIDAYHRLHRQDTGQNAQGYLAPFAYFNVFLIDLKTSAVVAERNITASRTLSNALNKTSSDPWDILNSEQKLRVLDDMISHQITKSVPELFE